MSKERLTKKSWRNLDPWECCGQDSYCKRGCHENGGCTNGCIVPKLYSRLAEYEDLKEQGLLLRLPVAVGDVVYHFAFGKVFSAEVVEIKYICEAENYGKFIRQQITIDGDECGIIIIDFSDIGKKYFLAQSAAEEKLREFEREGK